MTSHLLGLANRRVRRCPCNGRLRRAAGDPPSPSVIGPAQCVAGPLHVAKQGRRNEQPQQREASARPPAPRPARTRPAHRPVRVPALRRRARHGRLHDRSGPRGPGSYRRVDAETRWQFRKGSLLLTLHAPHITALPGLYPGSHYRQPPGPRTETKGEGGSRERPTARQMTAPSSTSPRPARYRCSPSQASPRRSTR